MSVVPEIDRSVLSALADRFGVPAVDLRQVELTLTDLDLVPLEVARTHVVLPIRLNTDSVFLVMADPSDRRVIDELEFVSNRKVFPYVSTAEQLRAAIEQAYSARNRGLATWQSAARAASIAPGTLSPTVPTASAPPATLGGVGAAQNLRARTPLTAPPATMPTQSEAPHDLRLDDSLETEVLRVPAPPAARPGRPRPDALTLGSDASIGPAPPLAIPPSLTQPDALDSVFGPIAGVVGKSILIVDDEDDIRKLLARVLTEKGYRVLEADRGTTALAMVKQHAPDAILLDAMLPEVHGFEVCRRIKSSTRFGHTPVLMISAVYRGWRFREDLKSAYGVHDFIEKPFRLQDVLAAVESMVSNAPKPDRDPEAMAAEADRAFQRSVELYKNGQIDNAIALLEQAITLDPMSYRLHYHLALLVGRKGDVFRAIQELDAALGLHPTSFAVLKNLAVLYQQAGFKRKAIEMWERAVGASPDEPTRQQIKEHLLSML
ncbi:MAG: response regulator [Deltaproteobacteria bacterium]|nr:response regulator [Deltaproteobacteria bacterium]